MRICPKCRQEPIWHFAANTTRKTGVHHVILNGCEHLGELTASHALIPETKKAEIEARVNAKIEDLFAECTRHMTDGRREVHRIKLYPPGAGCEWENHQWVKDVRLRQLNARGFFEDCPH